MSEFDRKIPDTQINGRVVVPSEVKTLPVRRDIRSSDQLTIFGRNRSREGEPVICYNRRNHVLGR
jgi:hypothetical protein